MLSNYHHVAVLLTVHMGVIVPVGMRMRAHVKNSLACNVCEKGDIPFAHRLESSISCGPGAASRDLWRDLERSRRAPCSDYAWEITILFDALSEHFLLFTS